MLYLTTYFREGDAARLRLYRREALNRKWLTAKVALGPDREEGETKLKTKE